MSVRWTEEQKKVIDVRNKNVLVSAAAGSGKTAVLVERILSLVCGEGEDEKPLNVDRLLVVTFTKAAAAEMRERVGLALEKRLEAIQELYTDEPRVRVMSYDSLTVDFAQQMNAGFILRGIRTVNDFEYEKSIADVNRKLSGIETFILFTEPEHTHISSSIVRELLRYGKDISQFVPKGTNLY